MSSNKKGKKTKGITLSLQEFAAKMEDGQQQPTAGQNVIYAPKQQSMASWADEMEEDDLIMEKERIFLPSAPRASRGPTVDDNLIPKEPPFKAHLGNLIYDIDESEIYNFFRELDVLSVDIQKNNEHRSRGFGYVEFGSRQDLIDALCMNEKILKGRPVRINLGTQNDRGDRMQRGEPRQQPDETPDDWRSSMRTKSDMDSMGPPPPMTAFNRRGRDDGGDFTRGPPSTDFQRGPRRPPSNNGFDDFPSNRSSRPSYDNFEEDGMDTSWRDQQQQSRPPPPAPSHYGGGGGGDRDRGGDRRGGGDGPYMRRPAPPQNYPEDAPMSRGSSQDLYGGGGGGGGPRRGGNSEYEGGRGEERERRYSGRSSNYETPVSNRPSRENSTSVPSQSSEPPRERKKLVLAPRTVANKEEEDSSVGPASIFGGAKPVDTASREREIEEKLAKLSVTPDSPTNERTRTSSQPIRILQRSQSNTSSNTHYPSTSSSGGNQENLRANEFKKQRDANQRQIMMKEREREKKIEARVADERQNSVTSITSSARTISTSSIGSQNSLQQQPFSSSTTALRLKSESSEDQDESIRKERSEPAPIPTENAWSRRTERGDSDIRRQSPDSSEDRNGEKERDSHSEPEDDRDNNRYIREKHDRKHGSDEDFRRSDRRDFGGNGGGQRRGEGGRGGMGSGPPRDRDNRERRPMDGPMKRNDMNRAPRTGSDNVFSDDGKYSRGGSSGGGGYSSRGSGSGNRPLMSGGGGGPGGRREERPMGRDRERDGQGPRGPPRDVGGSRGMGQQQRPPPRNFGEPMNRDKMYNRGDGFQDIRSNAREPRPMPKQSEEKPASWDVQNKFSLFLGDEDAALD